MRDALPIALTRLLEYISTINSVCKMFDPYDHYAACCVTLSLYSTATQNYWRQGLALGNTKINQQVGIFWRYLTLKFALPPTPTPDASQWNIGGAGSSGVGHIYFMYI